MPFDTAVHSGLSIGTPGVVRLLETVAPPSRQAAVGATCSSPPSSSPTRRLHVSQRLYFLLRWYGPDVFIARRARATSSTARAAPGRSAIMLKNPRIRRDARRRIAAGGADAFYAGPIAEAIVAAAKAAPNFAGRPRRSADLAAYQVKERPPLCVAYRARRICGMGPPSSGGIAVAQTMKLVEPFDLGRGPGAAMNTPAHASHHRGREARLCRPRPLSRRSRFRPRARAGLLDRAYLATPPRADRPAEGHGPAAAGRAARRRQAARSAIDATLERAGTSHLSVVDADGNAVAMTTTIEGAFGSGVWAAGFLLNNQLTDFSLPPRRRRGQPIANRVEGGKRPRSSMAPTIVFDDKGEVFAVLGSPGGIAHHPLCREGPRRPPRLGPRRPGGGRTAQLRQHGRRRPRSSTAGPRSGTALKLKGYGHGISPDLMNSGLHIVVVRGGQPRGRRRPAPRGRRRSATDRERKYRNDRAPHHRRRRRHPRPLAGADAGPRAAMPCASRGERRAVRAQREPHAGAMLAPGLRGRGRARRSCATRAGAGSRSGARPIPASSTPAASSSRRRATRPELDALRPA